MDKIYSISEVNNLIKIGDPIAILVNTFGQPQNIVEEHPKERWDEVWVYKNKVDINQISKEYPEEFHFQIEDNVIVGFYKYNPSQPYNYDL